jgi:hypothetical protein
MTNTERAVFCALMLSIVAIPSPARARNPEAVEHFEAGRRLVREGRWEDAATEFEASLALEQAVGPLLNLATAYEKLGRLASALKTFRAAHDLAAQTPDDEARAAEAARRADEIEPSVPTLTVVANAEITVEVEGLGPIAHDTPIAIDPGRHVVLAKAPDKRTRTLEVVASPHDKLKVVVPALDEPLRVSESSRPIPPKESSHGTMLTYAAIGAGVAGLVVGGAFGLAAAGDKRDLERLCPRYPSCPIENATSARDTDDAFARDATISTIGFVAGAALLATGVALYFFAPRAKTTARTLTIAF